MTKKIVWAALGYAAVSLALGASWHFVFFPQLYQNFGVYNRPAPIVFLGFLSMVMQGVVMALIYPRWYRGEAPLAAGLKFGLLMGVFLLSVSTIATVRRFR